VANIESLRIRQNGPFQDGYNSIAEKDGKNSDMLMDFGILKMKQGQAEINSENKERAYLLIHGEVIFVWEGQKAKAKRRSCFDENPWCLHVPAGVAVKITALTDETELSVHKKTNDKVFPAKLYSQVACRMETRGTGTMNETSTRVVKTILDKSISKDANLVLGEIICYPGKWAGFPPHHHPQPEIYFYKFSPENGYGFLEVGEDVVKVKQNDAVKLAGGTTHPHVAAPGYAMYIIWVIAQMENDPYIKPTDVAEHQWLFDPSAKIWPEK
jgi:5-deoxy-glucuronate isomerase